MTMNHPVRQPSAGRPAVQYCEASMKRILITGIQIIGKHGIASEAFCPFSPLRSDEPVTTSHHPIFGRSRIPGNPRLRPIDHFWHTPCRAPRGFSVYTMLEPGELATSMPQRASFSTKCAALCKHEAPRRTGRKRPRPAQRFSPTHMPSA